MTAASQEMADLLREVQKLQKELQPVRSAVAALQKRESETPNPAAAGASLHKVASRLETVRLKYEPFLTRLQELLSDEVPAFLQQTPLLAVGEEGFNEVKATDAAYDTEAANASLAPAAARSLNRSTAGDTGPQAAQHAQAEDAAKSARPPRRTFSGRRTCVSPSSSCGCGRRWWSTSSPLTVSSSLTTSHSPTGCRGSGFPDSWHYTASAAAAPAPPSLQRLPRRS